MKKDIHKDVYPVIFRDSETGVEFFSTSTMKGEKKETRDGVEYEIIPVEVSSSSHPFYTGENIIIDIAGRVEKFKKRQESAKKRGQGPKKV